MVQKKKIHFEVDLFYTFDMNSEQILEQFAREILDQAATVREEDIETVEVDEDEKCNGDNEDSDHFEEKYMEQFIEDMEKVGIDWEEYHGRFFYHGPAVRTHEKGFPTLQDVIRSTKVGLQWDNLGLDFIVYPVKKNKKIDIEKNRNRE